MEDKQRLRTYTCDPLIQKYYKTLKVLKLRASIKTGKH